MLVVLNLPLIGLWVKLLKVPYRLLFPAIMVFSAIGIYSVNNSLVRDLSRRRSSACIGFVWIKLGCRPAPMLLGFVLGPMMEENLRRAHADLARAIRRCSSRGRSASRSSSPPC